MMQETYYAVKKTGSCYKPLCRIKFLVLLPLQINFSYEQNLTD